MKCARPAAYCSGAAGMGAAATALETMAVAVPGRAGLTSPGRSTYSIIAIGARSPARNPARMTRV
jgi:hypothetical protein